MNSIDTLQQATVAQNKASDPASSIWVMANAGSGKTHVLVNRVIRLMLDGVEPEHILCLTYTRAAAAEMSDRLFKQLGKWILFDDEKLIDLIHNNTGHVEFKPENLDRARQLFTRAMEAPGGLKIQTIHAFCERLLQQFPIEAGVTPGFQVMEEHDALNLLSAARTEALAALLDPDETGEGHSRVGAIEAALAHSTGSRFEDLIKALLDRRHALRDIWGQSERLAHLIEDVRTFLRLPAGETPTGLIGRFMEDLDEQLYLNISAWCATSTTKTNAATAEKIKAVLRTPDQLEKLAALDDLFLTQAKTPRADTGLITANFAPTNPVLAEQLYAERARVLALHDQLQRLHILTSTSGLLHLASEIITRYKEKKRQRGLYDYDDLIGKTLAMFAQRPDADWVLYRLDGGIDHVLIDEAQDTSPEQWEIIRFLTSEFFAGEGQRPEVERTLFVVGDRKQSIYSFQGADPQAFNNMSDYFATRARAARRKFDRIPLNVSFRSTIEVLNAVDAVFNLEEARRGVHLDEGARELHAAIRDGEAGLIEIWPAVIAQSHEKPLAWQVHQDAMQTQHPKLAVAQRIAAEIDGWTNPADPSILQSRGRPVEFGDILILLRKRSSFMGALVRALKQRNIPVAGADRLELNDHIAIQDLKAAARFALLPLDDLTLAVVLKSPLVARDDGMPFSDEDLLSLCAQRRETPLWERLQHAVHDNKPYGQAMANLKTWLNRIDTLGVYEFFSSLLSRDGGRKRLLTRLGTEANEPLDAFLTLALDYDRGRAASMHDFLARLEVGDAVIKRDQEQGNNEVRIMTVHAAKGLEADIVILPDTCALPEKQKESPIIFSDEAGKTLPLLRPAGSHKPPILRPLEEARTQRNIEEYNRLLYVAMTRARDRLYITGFSNGAPAQGCWYDLTIKGLVDGSTQDTLETCHDENGAIHAWRIGAMPVSRSQQASPGPVDGDRPSQAMPREIPAWAWRAPAREVLPSPWLAPSRLGKSADAQDDTQPTGPVDAALSPLAGDRDHRFQRGNLIHKLLQLLPEIDPDQRAAAATQIAQRPGWGLDEAAQQTAIAEVCRIIDHPELSSLFGPGGRAEVPIAAIIDVNNQNVGLTGQIDRLIIQPRQVMIIDYKTNRPPPSRLEDTPAAYVNQMEAYRLALKRIYPEKQIRCFLLWTHAPSWLEIPG